ncbi:class II aaRS and biotin synthetase [Wallemia mellicola]|nr:class II aaRS and biotin synthetase [Wallemia mellicola]
MGDKKIVAPDALRAQAAVQQSKVETLQSEQSATPDINSELNKKKEIDEAVNKSLKEKKKLDGSLQEEQVKSEYLSEQSKNVKNESTGHIRQTEETQKKSLQKEGGTLKNKTKSNTPKYNLKTPKGTKDWSPLEMSVREHIFNTITGVFKKHGGVTIDTPVFELKEILAGKYGEDSKLIYDLQDQGGEICSLRYDLTVPFARYLAANSIPSIKRYHIAKVYRRDQPAMTKGRMREFYQCDFDIAGSFDPMIPDAEVLAILSETLSKLDVGPFTIKINHRKILDGIFELSGVPQDKIRTISSAVDKLDKLPWEDVKKEMTDEKGLDSEVADRIGEYVKLSGGRDLLEKLQQDSKMQSNEKAKKGIEEMEILLNYLEIFGVLPQLSFDLSLARGLDYYTGVIYEAVVEGSKAPVLAPAATAAPAGSKLQPPGVKHTGTKKGSKDAELKHESDIDESQIGVGSIAAGGRYDELAGMFAGGAAKDQIPCVGISIGVERVFSILMQRVEKEQQASRAKQTEVYVMAIGDGLLAERMQVAKQLWDNNIKAEFFYKAKPKLPKQFEVVDKERIPFGLLLAPREWNEGQVRIKEQKGKEDGSGDVCSSSISIMSEKQIARERFQAVFSKISDECLQYLRDNQMPAEAVKWFNDNLQYNTPGGKLNRGMSVVDTYAILKGGELSDAEYEKAAILGWCIELLQAYFLVADDMMDGSITRRGQPCWYRQPQVGNIAINDAFMLEAAIYHILKLHFKKESYYGDLLELFHDITFKTELGQLVDLITADEEHVDLSKFSLEKHHYIVVYKTAFYSFYLPVALAMYMAGLSDEKQHQNALDVLIPLGEYFQVQDDYLDAFGKPEQIGKIGTDIEDNKCSWCVCIALQLANQDQRKTLDDNYGRKNPEQASKIKELYAELAIEDKFKSYEKDAHDRIVDLIEKIDESSGMRKQVYYAFLYKVFGRTK